MKRLMVPVFAAVVAVAIPAFPLPAGPAEGRAVVTVLPKGGRETHLTIEPSDLALKVAGKSAEVTEWTALNGDNGPLELVLLIDSGTRSSLGTQNAAIQDFFAHLPAGSRAGIAYMQNGRALFDGPLSSDPNQVLKSLHLPGGAPGQSGSPYFCLSDLAQHWPSQNSSARREVVMITDGIDRYSPVFDPEDPYVRASIRDAARAGLVVYGIYWTNAGMADRSLALSSGGQSLLQMVADATGGVSYWNGTGNPVSFDGFFRDLRLRFDHQYRLRLSTTLQRGAELLPLHLKMGGPAAKVTAPQQVYITPAGE